MNTNVAAPEPVDDGPPPAGHGPAQASVMALAIGAVGVVFGDIGTSPLYALKETFVGHHPLPIDILHVFGVLSLIFWSFLLIVTLKYVLIVMQADNKGEGGSLALLALISRKTPGKRGWTVTVLAVLATALFFGDAIITPSISVLSAVEGLIVVNEGFKPLVLPLSIAILIGLFVVQSRGTAVISRFFGPIVLVYFAVLAVLGIIHIAPDPTILTALSPHHAVAFFMRDPGLAFLSLGAVVLAITGAEALYADMGHFGRRPIALAWVCVVFPSLILNYLGQCAMLLRDPSTIANPFFLMAPEALRLPLVILATLATIIASQALITGAYSVVQQAVQLGLMPRVRIAHTSESALGQIYVPSVNWGLLVLVILVVVTFRESTNLIAAYGLAVIGTMFITTCLITVLMVRVWQWPVWRIVLIAGLFFIIDGLFLAANIIKVPQGGWFPLVVAVVVFTLLTTWAKGRQLMIDRMNADALPLGVFIKSSASATRVPNTAVFMTSAKDGVPPALLHNLKHNMVLHERNLLVTVQIADMPFVAEERRITTQEHGHGFYRVMIHYGFMDEVDVPAALALAKDCGISSAMRTSFFLSRQTLIAADRPGMALWREHLFAWMLRNAESAMEFFKLPTNRVVELGSQVEI